uniref:Uncharacterized protein n=1 Tax=Caenorhabditis japonica TaxID=281687 RepID=A0A8R1IFV8_CAEJA
MEWMKGMGMDSGPEALILYLANLRMSELADSYVSRLQIGQRIARRSLQSDHCGHHQGATERKGA